MYEKRYFDMSELAFDILREAYSEKTATAALFYEDAKELVQELIRYDEDLEIENISDLGSTAMNGYDKEYYVTVTDDGKLFVEQACMDGVYLRTDSDSMFVDEEASSKIVIDRDFDLCVACEIYRGDEYDDCEDCDCEDCEYRDECDECDCEDDEEEFNKPDIHFSFDDDGAFKFIAESDIYIPLFHLIGHVIENADYDINDDGNLEININTNNIFEIIDEDCE